MQHALEEENHTWESFQLRMNPLSLTNNKMQNQNCTYAYLLANFW